MKIPDQEEDKYASIEARTCTCLCWITASVEEGEEGKPGRVRVATCPSEGRETVAAAQSAAEDNKGRLTGRRTTLGQHGRADPARLRARAGGCGCTEICVMRLFFMLFQESF